MKNKLFTLICLLFVSMLYSQSIDNISPQQRTDGSMIVDITYALSGPEADYHISAEVSFDDGVSFSTLSPGLISGDIGDNIPVGTGKSIEWDYGSQFPDQYSSTTRIKITADPWSCGDDLYDERDEQYYSTVRIGSQCWMAENINIGDMITGSQINNSTIEKHCYDNNTLNCDEYGGLYMWQEAILYNSTQPVQGICTPDWHIPSMNEWYTLVDFLGGQGVAGGKLKETGIVHWQSPNQANNSSGFTALGAGFSAYPNSSSLLQYAYFWSSENYLAWFLRYNNEQAIPNSYGGSPYGFSVRCVKNE